MLNFVSVTARTPEATLTFFMKDVIANTVMILGLAGFIIGALLSNGWLAFWSMVVVLGGGALYVFDKGDDA